MSNLKIILAFLFISLVIYSNSLRGDFIFDDYTLLVDNADIKQLHTLPNIFTSNAFKSSSFVLGDSFDRYLPLVSLSFAVDYSLWKLNRFGYHLENVLLHSLNAFLVFCLIFLLFSDRRLALATSLLFCVHPIFAESVNFISGRTDLLSGLFALLTLVFYLKYTVSKKWIELFIVLFSFICALLTRESGFLIFLPVFILFTGLRAKLSRGTVLLHVISFSGLLVIYAFLRLTILLPVNLIPKSPLPFSLDILNFFNILARYVGLLVFPFTLYILRTTPLIASFLSLSALAPAMFFLSLALALFLSIRKKQYIVIFGMAWFILGMLYLLKFMYKLPGRVSMDEHWLYIPAIGFFIIASYLFLKFKNRRIAKFAGIFIIFIYCLATFINSGYWRERRVFYRHNLQFVVPDVANILRLSFVSELCREGNYKEALSEVNKSLATSQDNWMAYLGLGDILRALKRYPEAKQAYENALKIDYFCWQANRKLKNLALELGERYEDYTIASGLTAEELKIVSLVRMGYFDYALALLAKNLEAAPTPQLYTLAGVTLGKMGKFVIAEELFQQALKLDTSYSPAWCNLAILYEKTQDYKKADACWIRSGRRENAGHHY